ncbi:MAG TPA: hypothetical protein VKW08_11005 [Xanthobacteraceae bacterium]|nr:hypothetical protein [Xanthobacteraceae bacterium]
MTSARIFYDSSFRLWRSVELEAAHRQGYHVAKIARRLAIGGGRAREPLRAPA